MLENIATQPHGLIGLIKAWKTKFIDDVWRRDLSHGLVGVVPWTPWLADNLTGFELSSPLGQFADLEHTVLESQRCWQPWRRRKPTTSVIGSSLEEITTKFDYGCGPTLFPRSRANTAPQIVGLYGMLPWKLNLPISARTQAAVRFDLRHRAGVSFVPQSVFRFMR